MLRTMMQLTETATTCGHDTGAVPHPGFVLAQQFMRPSGLTIEEMAQDIGFPVAWLERIICGERRVSYMTALRLGGYFHTTPQFWLDLQERYDCAQTAEAIVLGDNTDRCHCSSLPCTGIGPGMNAASVRQLFTPVKAFTAVHLS
jgi:addiction module HigA family antidote